MAVRAPLTAVRSAAGSKNIGICITPMPQPRVCVQSSGVVYSVCRSGGVFVLDQRLVQRQAGSIPGAGADVGH